jgi:RNA polymerase sigma-70 factor, ECF subfamily
MRKDEKAKFLEAYDLYADAIYRHCFFRVMAKQRAEDLMQEAFTKAWAYVSGGKSVDNMRAFLYKIANNLIIDESRKKKEDHLDALLEDDRIKEPSYEGHKSIEAKAELSYIMNHVKKLPAEEQQLIIMRYIDDLDPKDIAEVTGLTPNHISVKVHRALKTLRQYI